MVEEEKVVDVDGNEGGGGVGSESHWWWGMASAAQLGWGIVSLRRGYTGHSNLMPFKAFTVASLFVGSAASASVASLHASGIHKDMKHFTDLVRQFMHPNNYVASSEYAGCRYSAKELDRAGVDFVPCTNKFLTDIKFNKEGNILKVPHFLIGDNTECLMRNVMGLEQCLYPFEARIFNYISLLDQLINTNEDVELLVKKKIVVNWLGSNNAVADLVNKLCDETLETSFCHRDICVQLNKLHENFWNVIKATLEIRT